jgi:hypothetical protein
LVLFENKKGQILAEVIEIVDDKENAWPLRSFIAKLIVSTCEGNFLISNLTFSEIISIIIKFYSFYS